MTMTAPIPVLDLRTAILQRHREISARVHVPESAVRVRWTRYAATRQLEAAQATARLALTKNLEPAGLRIEDGTLVWDLDRDWHGDGWTLTVVWCPR